MLVISLSTIVMLLKSLQMLEFVLSERSRET